VNENNLISDNNQWVVIVVLQILASFIIKWNNKFSVLITIRMLPINQDCFIYIVIVLAIDWNTNWESFFYKINSTISAMRIPICCILLLAFVGFSHGNVVSPRRKLLTAIYFLSWDPKNLTSHLEMRNHFLIRDFDFSKSLRRTSFCWRFGRDWNLFRSRKMSLGYSNARGSYSRLHCAQRKPQRSSRFPGCMFQSYMYPYI
jgi:hypothetical protein